MSLNEYVSRDISDDYVKSILYSKLEFYKMALESDCKIQLSDKMQNEIFYDNYLYEDPIKFISGSLAEFDTFMGNGDIKKMQMELFGKVLTRYESQGETRNWVEQFLTSDTVPIPVNGGISQVKVRLHKKVIGNFKAAMQEIIDTHALEIINNEVGHFYYRTVNNGTGTKKLSYHAYGVAIDFNWTVNPYKHGGKPLSDTSSDNITTIRSTSHPAVIIMKKHGFGWGGRYGDYMHFSVFNGC